MTGLPVHERVGVDEFERMIAAGVFAPDTRLELIEGEIVAMSPIGDPHEACVDRLAGLFSWRCSTGRTYGSGATTSRGTTPGPSRMYC